MTLRPSFIIIRESRNRSFWVISVPFADFAGDLLDPAIADQDARIHSSSLAVRQPVRTLDRTARGVRKHIVVKAVA
jgi:hypothetical protein